MVEEKGVLEEEESAVGAACATFFSFLIVGAIPLISYLLSYMRPDLIVMDDAFQLATVLTGLTIFSMGALKSQITKTNWIRSGFEMFLIGGFASLVAFYVGHYLSFIGS